MARKIILGLVICVAGIGAAWFLLPKPKPNVIVILLDTLRADHLGVYGYERKITPNLDEFSRQSLKLNYLLTSAPWTPCAVASLFTGLYVSGHGMLPPNGLREALKQSTKFADSNLTLAEIFKANGYTTAAVSSNPWISNKFGFEQGFDQFFLKDRARADEMNKRGLKALSTLTSQDNPFFLYLHYLDPHEPYDAPGEFENKFSGPLKRWNYNDYELSRLNPYDGEINYLDTHLGHLFQKLREQGLWEDTVIVIVADHGEQFGERGHRGHGFFLYNEEVHVPALVKAPGLAGKEIDFTTSIVDLFSTVLDLAGLEVPGHAQGISVLDEKGLRERPGVLSEIVRKFAWKSFTSPEGKALLLDYGDVDQVPVTKEPRTVGIFDRHADYQFLKPISDTQLERELRLELDSILAHVTEKAPETKSVEVDSNTLENLRSLGYMK